APLDPPDRPAQLAGEEGDQQVLGVDMALAAKSAADIERDTANPRLRQAEESGGFAAYPMYYLGRGPDGHRIRARTLGADDAAAPHGHGGVGMGVESTLQPMWGTGQRRVGVAFADRERADQIGVKPVMDDRAIGPQRRLRVHHRRQLFQAPTHALGG